MGARHQGSRRIKVIQLKPGFAAWRETRQRPGSSLDQMSCSPCCADRRQRLLTAKLHGRMHAHSSHLMLRPRCADPGPRTGGGDDTCFECDQPAVQRSLPVQLPEGEGAVGEGGRAYGRAAESATEDLDACLKMLLPESEGPSNRDCVAADPEGNEVEGGCDYEAGRSGDAASSRGGIAGDELQHSVAATQVG